MEIPTLPLATMDRVFGDDLCEMVSHFVCQRSAVRFLRSTEKIAFESGQGSNCFYGIWDFLLVPGYRGFHTYSRISGIYCLFMVSGIYYFISGSIGDSLFILEY